MTPCWRDERGFATITGAFAIAAVAAVALAVLYVGGAVLARHRAQSAADLAALAGAADLVMALPDPCATARKITEGQRTEARLRSCRTDGTDVVLTVAVPVALGPFGMHEAVATARAGPVG